MNRIQRILQQLGIDIFTVLRYDTWVIQTIWGRIINNRGTKTWPVGRQICSIGSLWCLYHHGCQPNAAIAPLETPAGMTRWREPPWPSHSRPGRVKGEKRLWFHMQIMRARTGQWGSGVCEGGSQKAVAVRNLKEASQAWCEVCFESLDIMRGRWS